MSFNKKLGGDAKEWNASKIEAVNAERLGDNGFFREPHFFSVEADNKEPW